MAFLLFIILSAGLCWSWNISTGADGRTSTVQISALLYLCVFFPHWPHSCVKVLQIRPDPSPYHRICGKRMRGICKYVQYLNKKKNLEDSISHRYESTPYFMNAPSGFLLSAVNWKKVCPAWLKSHSLSCRHSWGRSTWKCAGWVSALVTDLQTRRCK